MVLFKIIFKPPNVIIIVLMVLFVGYFPILLKSSSQNSILNGSVSNPPIPSSNPPMSSSNPPMSSSNPPMSSSNPPMSSSKPSVSPSPPPIPSANPPMSSSKPPFVSSAPPPYLSCKWELRRLARSACNVHRCHKNKDGVTPLLISQERKNLIVSP
jgi:hypothetical protein